MNKETIQAIESIAKKILDRVENGSLTPTILIDGRAGSGKSTIAKHLQEILFKDGESLPRVIHMDNLFSGWQGLSDGSDYLVRFILQPLKTDGTASWQNWSWVKDQRGSWAEFSGGTPLIVEGCGSLTTRSSEHAFLRIWIEASDETRAKRWLEREGNDEKFLMWGAQELDFYAREKSKELADLVIANN
jgi:uridine kinase